MKRWLLIASVCLSAALLATPWLVARSLQTWVPAWISSWEAETRFDSRWLHSTLDAAWPTGASLRLQARHLPLRRPAWLRASGQFLPNADAVPIDLSVRLELSGQLAASASGEHLAWTAPDPQGAGRRIELNDFQADLNRSASTAIEARARAHRVHLFDGLGNALKLDEFSLQADTAADESGRQQVHLEIAAVHQDKPPSRVRVAITGIDPDRLAELIAGLEALGDFAPDSWSRRMAELHIAATWQQLVQAGLRLERLALELDQRLSLEGRWPPLADQPVLAGQSDPITLRNWLQLILGLARHLSPSEAAIEAEAWIESLTRSGWLTEENDGLAFRYPDPFPTR